MKLKLSEAQIEHSILMFLYSEKIWAWKNPSAGYFDMKRKVFRKQRSPFAINGVSDIVGVFKGRPFFCEVKSKTGKLLAEQKAFLERAEKEGAICIVARSVEDVKAALEKLK